MLWSRGSRAFVLASGVAACGLSSCCSGALDYRLNSCGNAGQQIPSPERGRPGGRERRPVSYCGLMPVRGRAPEGA